MQTHKTRFQLKMDKWNWLSAKVCTCTFWTCCMQSTASIVCLAVFDNSPEYILACDDTFRICTFIICLIELIISKHLAVGFYFSFIFLYIALQALHSKYNEINGIWFAGDILPRSNNLLSPLIIICKLLFNSFFVDLQWQRVDGAGNWNFHSLNFPVEFIRWSYRFIHLNREPHTPAWPTL